MKCVRHSQFGIEPNDFAVKEVTFIRNGTVPGTTIPKMDAYCAHCIKKVRQQKEQKQKRVPIDQTSK